MSAIERMKRRGRKENTEFSCECAPGCEIPAAVAQRPVC